MSLIKGKQMRIMTTQLPQAPRQVTETLSSKKGAFYSNQAALLGEVISLWLFSPNSTSPEGSSRLSVEKEVAAVVNP